MKKIHVLLSMEGLWEKVCKLKENNMHQTPTPPNRKLTLRAHRNFLVRYSKIRQQFRVVLIVSTTMQEFPEERLFSDQALLVVLSMFSNQATNLNLYHKTLRDFPLRFQFQRMVGFACRSFWRTVRQNQVLTG